MLLLFSLAYVACRSVRPAPAGPHGPLRPAHLVGLAAAIALGTAAIRLVFEMNSDQSFNAHVWQWPQCIGLFVLGLAAAERGWLAPVPAAIRRGGGWAALVGAVVLLAAIATAENPDAFVGGLRWQALLIAALEGVISVGLSVWLLGTFERRFDHAGPLATELGRAAFGAYVLQAPVLLACALFARPLPVAPEVKFLLVAPAGIAGSFALACSPDYPGCDACCEPADGRVQRPARSTTNTTSATTRAITIMTTPARTTTRCHPRRRTRSPSAILPACSISPSGVYAQ